MPQTVEVRFKGNRKGLYDWAGTDDQLRMRDPVIVDADRGQDLGRISAVGETALKKCGSSCGGCASGEAPPATAHRSCAGRPARRSPRTRSCVAPRRTSAARSSSGCARTTCP